MCSSSKCDIPGLINGPVGNLVGIGMKALLNGAPIGPRSVEVQRKPTDKENIEKFYDNVETHLRGALQVLQPALKIKRILEGECRSAGPERSALTPAAPIVYYSPQSHTNARRSVCSNRCCGVKKSSNCTAFGKSDVSKAPNRCCGDKSTAELIPQFQSCMSTADRSKKSKKSAAKKCSPCYTGEKNGDRSGSVHDNGGKASTAKPSKSKNSKCCLCNVTLKDNIAMAVLPCDHSFCYTCLAKAKLARCQKCDESFDMKNVSQIFRTD